MAGVIRLKYEKEILGNLNAFRALYLAFKAFIKFAVLKSIGHHMHNLELLAFIGRYREVWKVCSRMGEIRVGWYFLFVFQGVY